MATFPQTQAPPEIVDVPLSLFGGQHCGANPADLPEGLSPDNQDVAFVPGAVFSRPCLSRLFARPIPGGLEGLYPATVYAKTYVQPDGDPLTLFMDANGKIYVEDVAENLGVYTQLAQVTAGISAQSASAFGREYIALSDLLHGQWCPLQYDGTNLDRVTQDGPGVGPVCSNVAPAQAILQNTGVGTVYNISSLTPTDPVEHSRYSRSLQEWIYWTIYTTLTIITTAPNAIALGTTLAIAGVTPSSMNRTYVGATAVLSNTTFKIPYNQQDPTAGTGGTATVQNPSLARSNNIVTAVTSTAHGFQPGWQVQISIANVTIGGGLAQVSRDGNGVVTIQTTTPHGCPIGSQIAIVGVTNPDTSFNGTFTVQGVKGPTLLTYQQGGVANTSTAGTGNLQDIFSVTAFIQTIPSATSFTYQDIGPDDLTNVTGTATIIGQISPGRHGVVQMFLTRQGAITKPSPPVFFDANGAQQMLVTGLAQGPSNVVARLLGLTGAGGDNYFVIPATPQVGGQITGTSTLIPDNTTTAVVLDFSDNTLFAGIAIDQIGNDLFDQRVLAAPIGFYSYASRLICWGDFNKIENLLNMTLAAGTDSTTAGANAGSGANGTGITPWTNPNNITSPTAYADVTVGFIPGIGSQQLLCEAFGFAVVNNVTGLKVTLQYYSTGTGVAELHVQLLKAGLPFGTPQLVTIPSGTGTAGLPQGAMLNFPIAGLLASDVNNAAFGFELEATNTAHTSIDVFVRAGSISVTTSTFLPQGWTSAGSTSLTGLVVASTLPGMYQQYQMTSNGGLNDCMISQSAFQDAFGTFILSPSTKYLFRLFAAYGANLSGNLVADLFSPSTGLIASATLAFSPTATAGFTIFPFSVATPIAIPPDTLLRVYLQNVPASSVITIGEMSLPYALQPYQNNLAPISYVVNPEGFSQTTGNIGSADDPSDVRCFSAQRNSTLLKTAGGTHIFQSNDFEPYRWVVDNLSRTVGACSIRGGDPGQFGTGDAVEDWDITVNKNGWYLFAGGDFWRISQEISKGQGPQVTWDDINWAYQHTIWVKNDPSVHRAYAGVPVFGATTPNLIFVLDYRELDTASDLANAPALKIGLTGKMLSTDKTRKWTRWNISANCADILVRPENQKQMTFAGGPVSGGSYGNLYTLDPAKLTDDDYGAINPYYVTYGFVNHEQEQMLGLGTGRKLTRKICGFITGVGYVSIIPLVDSLWNPMPATIPQLLTADSDPSNLLGADLEWTCGIRGERQFFRIQVQPEVGSTDVQLKIQKLIVSMMKDPVSTHRGAVL